MSVKSSSFFLGCAVTLLTVFIVKKASENPKVKVLLNHTKEDLGLNNFQGGLNIFDKMSLIWQRIRRN
jgi:hypothetical protein